MKIFFLTLLFAVFGLPTVASAATFTNTNCTGDFDQGTFSDTTCASNAVSLDATGKTNGTGTYTSKIIDTGGDASWTTLSWTPVAPYGKELPNNGGSDTGYSSGNIDMTNNTLLLHMNEASGDVVDASTGGANMGESNLQYGSSGILGDALTFNGTNSDLYTPKTTVNYMSAGTKSVSIWIYPTGESPTISSSYTGDRVMGNDSSYSGGARYFGLYRGTIGGQDRIWAYNWDGNEDRVGVSYNSNEWTHIVIVHSGGTMSIYKNGSFVDSVASGNTSNMSGQVRFGSQGYTGRLDEAALFSDALSAQEISDIYERGALRPKFQLRSCSDATCSGNPDFVGPEGTTDSYYTELTSAENGLPEKSIGGITSDQYIQYRLTLESDSTSLTPTINDVTLTYSVTQAIPEFSTFLYMTVLVSGGWLVYRKLLVLKV